MYMYDNNDTASSHRRQSLSQKTASTASVAGPRAELDGGCLGFFDWSSVAAVAASPSDSLSRSSAHNVRARGALLLIALLSAMAALS